MHRQTACWHYWHWLNIYFKPWSEEFKKYCTPGTLSWICYDDLAILGRPPHVAQPTGLVRFARCCEPSKRLSATWHVSEKPAGLTQSLWGGQNNIVLSKWCLMLQPHLAFHVATNCSCELASRSSLYTQMQRALQWLAASHVTIHARNNLLFIIYQLTNAMAQPPRHGYHRLHRQYAEST